MRLTKGASAATQKYMADGIRYVCENFKRRSPGSHSERKAQKYLKKELEKWADKVEMEDFSVHPAAFMGWIPAAAVIGMLAVLFFGLHIRVPYPVLGLPLFPPCLFFWHLHALWLNF